VGGPSVVILEDGAVPAEIEVGADGLGTVRRLWPAAAESHSLLVTLRGG
jgi:hypothetical protein